MKQQASGELTLNTFYHGDSLKLFKKLPDACIDLVFADPPYNLQLQNTLKRPNATVVNGVNEKWDKFESFDAYDQFTVAWLKEVKRVLKPTGTLWVIGTYHNIFRIGYHLQNIGYWILNDVIWIKSNPMPNFRGVRFNNAHETLIWASPEAGTGYTFHYQSMKSMNDDLQMRSDWYFPICGGPERLRINGVKAHSTQKPEELLYRILLATSNPGDIILDPFSGSGTTAAVAKLLNRNFIAFEKEKKYIEISLRRLATIEPLPEMVTERKVSSKKVRIPIGTLIEAGLLQPGEELLSADKKFVGTLLSDGGVFSGEVSGTIHSSGGKLTGRDSVNGWTYWMVKRNGQYVLLDSVREQFTASHGSVRNNLITDNTVKRQRTKPISAVKRMSIASREGTMSQKKSGASTAIASKAAQITTPKKRTEKKND